MCQRTGTPHFCQVDDLPQRLIMGDGTAAAAGAEGNGEDAAIGNVLFADLQGRTEVFQCVIAHIEGSLTVILIHPVAVLAAPEAKSVNIVLTYNIPAAPEIRAGAPDIRKLRRGKAFLPGSATLGRIILRPFQCFLVCLQIGAEDLTALCHIVGIRFPVAVPGIDTLAIIESYLKTFGNFQFLGNAELFRGGLAGEVIFKFPGSPYPKCLGQLVGDKGILMGFVGIDKLRAADPAGLLFHIPAVQHKVLIRLHGILTAAYLFHDGLQRTNRINVLFLPGQPLFRGIVRAVIIGCSVQRIPHLLDEVDHIGGNTAGDHAGIVRLFPDIILSDVLFGLPLIHFRKVRGIKPPAAPKVLFRPADFLPEVLMLLCWHPAPPVPQQYG